MAEKAEKVAKVIINKETLVARTAEATGMTKVDVTRVVDALFGTQGKEPTAGVIADANKDGEVVQLIGFGTFEVAHRNARKGRNPQTGEEIEIAERKVPTFSPGKKYKEHIPQPGEKKAKGKKAKK